MTAISFNVFLQKNTREINQYLPIQDRLRQYSRMRSRRGHGIAFSACLLLKDANVLLPEWLAYHYTFLPLQRLIVAVDPFSYTDPRPILDMFRPLGLITTFWSNVSDTSWIRPKGYIAGYLSRRQMYENGTKYKKMMARFQYRQNCFYTACLRQLQKENRTWTMLIDVDEFLTFNYYGKNESPIVRHLTRNNGGSQDASSIKDASHRGRFAISETAAEHIASGADHLFDPSEKPCLIFSRPLFTSTESPGNITQRMMPPGFNATFFHTLKYHQRTPLQNRFFGKAIVDVSRYDGREVKNPHRPVGELCYGGWKGGRAFVRNEVMSFRVHHYVGSWETFQSPGFDSRGRHVFYSRNHQVVAMEVDDSLCQWLTSFVDLVGKEKAYRVTEGARKHAEKEKAALLTVVAAGTSAVQ